MLHVNMQRITLLVLR